MAAIEGSINGLNKLKYIVAENADGKIAGVMGMAPPSDEMLQHADTDRPVELINAYLAPDMLGAGTGRLLAWQLELLAKRYGHTEVLVNSGPRYKESGWPFWTRLYGEPAAVLHHHYGPGGDAQVWNKVFPAEE